MKLWWIKLSCVIFILSGCRTTVVPLESKVALPSAFDYGMANQQRDDLKMWWRHWQDPVLNDLMERGLHGNLDIQIARSRWQESMAQMRLAQADLGAQAGVNIQGGYGRGEVDNPLDSSVRGALKGMPAMSNLGADTLRDHGKMGLLGVSASWEPDVFGQKRSDADAAQLGALGAQEQMYGIYLLMSSEIADRYLQARFLLEQQRLIKLKIDTLQLLLRYANGRFLAGQAKRDAVEEAKAAIASMQAKWVMLQPQYDAQVRALAVLVGETPQSFRLPESQINIFAHLPSAPMGAVPSDLLNSRPDLRAHAAAVQARAAQYASAKADLLPRFSLQFLGQGIRIGLTGDNALNGWSSLISAGIHIPLFTNGRIQANIATADARLQTALLEYDRALLTALSEVDNAYQIYHALRQQTAKLQHAHQHQQTRSKQAKQLYHYGDQTLDHALRIQLDAYQAQEYWQQAQLAQAQSLLNIYKALGGGW